MKRLYASHNQVLLDQLVGELARAGIATLSRNMNMTGQAAGELPPIVCWPEIWVREDSDLAAAKSIVAEKLAALETPGADWHCPVCGEKLEGQFGSCWRCAGAEGDS